MKSTETKLLMETWRKFLNESEYDIDNEEFPGEEEISGEVVYEDLPPADLPSHLDEESNQRTELGIDDGLRAELGAKFGLNPDIAVLSRKDGAYIITLYKEDGYDSKGEKLKNQVGQEIDLEFVTIENGKITKVMM